MGSSKVINTSVIRDNIALLENERRYFSNKKASFSKNAYGSASNLVNYLGKIQEIYNTIAQNISNLNDYLKSYVNDAEGLESQMAGRGRTVSVDSVNSIINRYENTINNFKIDSDNIFEVNEYNATSVNHTNDGTLLEKMAATVLTCGLSFLEGVVNVGEMLVDGGAMIASAACSIFGNTEGANTIGEFVQKDLSKDLYHSVVNVTGLDEYIDPDGTAASICSMAGNIVGMVGISLLTGGAAAGAFGAGTATATAVTMGVNMGIGALTNMGSEGQLALERGANINEAQAVATVAGAVGLAQGAISGKLDAASRGVGASVGKNGLGKILGYTTAAFGIGASEPLINEMAQTAIYRKTEETGLVDSFLTNAEEDGLLFQMALAGGMNALGTYGNGLGGIKRYNTLASQIEKALKTTDTTVIEIADISEISPDLQQKISNSNNKIIFKTKDGIYKYKGNNLKKLEGTIIVDNKLVQTIGGRIDVESTQKLFTISYLLDLLNSSDKRVELENLDLEEQQAVGNALKDLMITLKKNKIDLGLSKQAIKESQNLIEKYSYDFVADKVGQSLLYKMGLKMIELDFDSNPKAIFADDVQSIIAIASDDYCINFTDNPKIKEFCENFTSLYDKNIKNIVKQDIDVGNRENYAMVYEWLTRDKMNISEFDYLSKYHSYLKPYSPKLTNFSDFIYGDANGNNKISGLIDTFSDRFGKYLSKSQIEKKLDNHIYFATDKVFNRGPGVAGVYSRASQNILINLKYAYDAPNMLDSAVCHESLHAISNNNLKYQTPFGKYQIGIEETITEFLNKKILGIYNPSGYDYAVECLDSLVKNDILDLDTIQDAYFHRDQNIIINHIKKLNNSISSSYFKKLFNAFDKAIEGCTKEDSLELNDLVNMLIFEIREI